MLIQLQLFLQGLAAGSLYGVLGLGMHLILGSTGKVHLGIGQIAVIAALAWADVSGWCGLTLLPAALGGGMLLGVLSYQVHPGRLWRTGSVDQGERGFLLITLGGALSLEGLAQWVWPLPVTALGRPSGMLFLAGTPLFSNTKALALVASLAVSLLLSGLLRWSRRGKALRAWNMGSEELRLVGVDPQDLGRWITSVGLGLAGLVGVLLSATQVVSVQDGLGWTIKALCLAIVGRALSPLRTMGLGWAMGIGETMVSQWLGSQWHPALAPTLLILVLSIRNKGLR